MGKEIRWELCKKFKSDHTNKWYMLNLESILESMTHKILWDLEIQTDYLISARQPDLVIVNNKKKTCRIEYFTVRTDHRVQRKKNGKKISTRPCQRTEKIMEYESDCGTNCNPCILYTHQIKRRVETIQMIALFRLARILRRVLET